MTKKNEERLVCDILNDQITTTDIANPLYSNSKAISSFIKSKFPNIIKAKDTGQDHSCRGDILLTTDTQKFEIELKVLTSGSNSKGTLANTSQNILADQGIINNGIGWEDWRKETNYDKKILNQLNRNIISSTDIENILKEQNLMNSNSEIEKKARVVRKRVYKIADRYNLSKASMASLITKINQMDGNLLSNEELIAVDSIDSILKIARSDLKSYLEFNKAKGINNANLKKLISCLKYGYHTIPQLNIYMSKSLAEIEEASENYYIIYYYPLSPNKTFQIEGPKQIKEWVDSSTDIDGYIEGESLWIKRNGETILQLKFHWRNVFFGIATPSVEIFDKLIVH